MFRYPGMQKMLGQLGHAANAVGLQGAHCMPVGVRAGWARQQSRGASGTPAAAPPPPKELPLCWNPSVCAAFNQSPSLLRGEKSALE